MPTFVHVPVSQSALTWVLLLNTYGVNMWFCNNAVLHRWGERGNRNNAFLREDCTTAVNQWPHCLLCVYTGNIFKSIKNSSLTWIRHNQFLFSVGWQNSVETRQHRWGLVTTTYYSYFIHLLAKSSLTLLDTPTQMHTDSSAVNLRRIYWE